MAAEGSHRPSAAVNRGRRQVNLLSLGSAVEVDPGKFQNDAFDINTWISLSPCGVLPLWAPCLCWLRSRRSQEEHVSPGSVWRYILNMLLMLIRG
ncbi:unnamed protein product [Boreogadus saida]